MVVQRCLLAATLALAVALPALAQEDSSLAGRRMPPTIDVTGEAEVTAEPDIATFTVGVTVRDPSPQVAMEQMARQMDAVKTALQEQGVAQDQMKTVQLTLNEYREPKPTTEPNRPPEYIKGYEATHRLEVKVRRNQFDKIGAILGAANKAGANEVGNVTFGIEDDTDLKLRGLEAAVKNAHAKAEAMARGAGVSLGRPYHLSESSGIIRPYEGRAAFSMMAGAAPAPQPVPPSEITRRITVSATYLLGS